MSVKGKLYSLTVSKERSSEVEGGMTVGMTTMEKLDGFNGR
jgi:hypothetical protein